jgi:beta-glucosidase-like glycosyl hydrolase/CubicO group peptidase (beta-lactamase class C family)
MTKRFIFLLFAVGLIAPLMAQNANRPFLETIERPHAWADSLAARMTLDEKIGQLMMVAAFSDQRTDTASIGKLIREYHIGGLIFFQGTPQQQAFLTNYYQRFSKVPLMVAMDGEWGLGMRLEQTQSFPYQMTLGALTNDSLIYQMGREIAAQCKRLGVHVNFAPVVDINNNPANPVIGYRSFGEDKMLVSRKGIAYMRGLQDGGVLATAKHFPGHGDTQTDSHYDLPTILHGRSRLEQIELYPFAQLIQAGIGGMMIAHLNIPSLDNTPNLPSTLSKPMVDGLLKQQMGFKGLIFSDAMNMKGVTKYFTNGEAEVRALIAGNDILEYVEDVPLAIEKIKEAMLNGRLSEQSIHERCVRVLKAKSWLGLQTFQPIALEGLAADLNPTKARLISRQLTEQSLTVLRNEGNVLPLKQIHPARVAVVSVGPESPTVFQCRSQSYHPQDLFWLPKAADDAACSQLLEALKNYDWVIIGLHHSSVRAVNRIEYTPSVLQALNKLFISGKAITASFMNPYTLDQLDQVAESRALVLAYQGGDDAEDLAAQLIWGGIGASGKLPVTLQKFRLGHGLTVQGGIRFKYTLPEEAGFASQLLQTTIDGLANLAIAQQAAPGMQVLIAKDQKIIFQKAYGYHTYENQVPVTLKDVYDLASITKIAAPLPVLMQLYEQGRYQLDEPVSKYFKGFNSADKKQITFRDMLTHTSRMTPFIAFWQGTVADGAFKKKTFQDNPSKQFPIEVTDNLFLHKKYPDRMYREIRQSALRPERAYVYSDLGSMVYPRVIENMTETNYAQYLREQFFDPLGAGRLTYNPLKRIPIQEIAPTEWDSLFRKRLVQGTVHDEAAAMLGGISGHAGLFGNAQDLAKLMQMYLNGGEYGGKRFLAKETLQEFTRYQFPDEGNRRGLGFDKPLLKDQHKGFPSPLASPNSFGHSGFTGTFTWADPDSGLLLIILSNRVYPTRNNRKIYDLDIYQKMHTTLYTLQGQLASGE